jgi:hypothetical protein
MLVAVTMTAAASGTRPWDAFSENVDEIHLELHLVRHTTGDRNGSASEIRSTPR